MDEEARTLAAALRQARARRDPEGYPTELRRRAGAWLARGRSRGETWVALGAALGLSSTTASNWARSSPEAGFLPVRTEPTPAPPPEPLSTAPPPSAVPPSSAVLVTPRGYRVQGLSTDALVFVLERLG